MLRDDSQRAMLFDLDAAIQQLNKAAIDDSARPSLVGRLRAPEIWKALSQGDGSRTARSEAGSKTVANGGVFS
jgi:hypothetical protein